MTQLEVFDAGDVLPHNRRSFAKELGGFVERCILVNAVGAIGLKMSMVVELDVKAPGLLKDEVVEQVMHLL